MNIKVIRDTDNEFTPLLCKFFGNRIVNKELDGVLYNDENKKVSVIVNKNNHIKYLWFFYKKNN